MSISLATGLSDHGIMGAQLNLAGLIVNGHDPSKILNLRNMVLNDIGIAAPAGTITVTKKGAGNLAAGVYLFRVRWYYAKAFVMSLPSAEITDTATGAEEATVNITNATAPNSRVTHWIVERTLVGGTVFHPVNRTSSNPNGTAFATKTLDESTLDSVIKGYQGLPKNQGQPTRRYPICWSNGQFLRMAGGLVHSPNCSLANGSPNVTSADGDFTSAMVGMDFYFPADADGVRYEVLAYVSVNAITLASNYAGTTKVAQPASICGKRDMSAWCEPNQPEYWGTVEVGALSNEIRVGMDGVPITAGIGLGPAGDLICKAQAMFVHSYFFSPKLAAPDGMNGVAFGDGKLMTIKARRGACGKFALAGVDGMVYGIDLYGVWRLVPGGEPQEIGGPISGDWTGLDFSKGDSFAVLVDASERLLYFFVVEYGDTYAKNAFVWDIDGQRWVGKRPNDHAGLSAFVQLPDVNGIIRPVVWNEVVGGAYSYPWFLNIGTSLGATPSTSPLVGTVTGAGGATTAKITAGAFPTTGEKLKGVPCTLVRAADLSEETTIITDNDADDLTFNALSGAAPANGDTIVVGAIPSKWITGRLWGNEEFEKFRLKKWIRAYVWLDGVNADAVDLKCRIYFDGLATAFADFLAVNEDGVQITAATAPITIKAGQQKQRYKFELGGQWKNDIQLEFYSLRSGDPWEILAVQVEYEVDDSEDPR